MNVSLRSVSLFLITLTLGACGQTQTSNAPPATPTPPQISVPPLSRPTASPSPGASPFPSPSVTAEKQTYQDTKGRFEISFPKGFVYQDTGSGVAFVSADQGFAGAVDFGSAQGQKLSAEQLEAALKTEYENRLSNVSWQKTERQSDGSIRVDWNGKDKQGNALDAVSFVEQRNDTIFILNLFGVNKPYQNYQQDAETIVTSYKVKAQSSSTAPKASPSPSKP
jgi:hypothetical protein